MNEDHIVLFIFTMGACALVQRSAVVRVYSDLCDSRFVPFLISIHDRFCSAASLFRDVVFGAVGEQFVGLCKPFFQVQLYSRCVTKPNCLQPDPQRRTLLKRVQHKR